MDGSDSTMVVWAILFSAFFAALIALVVVTQQRIIAKRRQSYDIIMIFLSREARDIRKQFAVMNSKDLPKLVVPENDEDREKESIVIRYLNHLETICACIRHNLVDEMLVKATIIDTIVKDFSKARALIVAIRENENDQDFFEHLEYVAKRWQQNPKSSTKLSLIGFLREMVRP